MNSELFPKSETRKCPPGYGIEREKALTMLGVVIAYRPYMIRKTSDGLLYKSFITPNKDYPDLDVRGTSTKDIAFETRHEATVFLFGFDWHMPPMPEGQLWRD